LLYARFIGHFFKKLGLVNEPEPFKQFLFNGKVTAQNGEMFSKSKGNGVDPLDIIGQGYGADALRTYLMFAAPLDQWIRWDPQGVPGTHRFLSRIWTLVREYLETDEKPADDQTTAELRRATHAMAKKMAEDIEENRYNTAIAAAMTAVNELYKLKVESLAKNKAWQEALEFVVASIAPFAPHMADELWLQLGHHTSVHKDSWPQWNDEYLAKDTVTLAVQVNGKLRAEIEVPADVSEADAIAAAQANDKVKLHTDGKQVVKSIYVAGKLVNLVVN
jgi:leucyl-tRNA synthetase